MKTAYRIVRRSGPYGRSKQRGVSLLIALLVLVAMTLAGLALVRSVDSATMLAGNLAFRQSAEASADGGMETAIAALRGFAASPTTLEANGSGYFAKVPDTDIDFTGNATPGVSGDDFDWSKAVTVASADTAGNTTSYVIHRLCNKDNTGPLDTATCSTWQDTYIPASGEGAGVPGEIYGDPTVNPPSSVTRGLYRVTVRISGPRSTFSYVQAIVII